METLKEEVKPNVFEKPWRNSDVILVVEGVELHVHRLFLTMQSPVFEAMMNGGFKEAKQKRINLKEEDPGVMVDFLKVLYPYKMFECSLNDSNIVTMLSVADKYQAEGVIKRCFDMITITWENVVKVLPFAVKYNQEACKKCISIAQRQVACSTLKETLPAIDHANSYQILLGKCEFLEGIVKEALDYLVTSMAKVHELHHKKKSESKVYCNLSHKVKVYSFNEARKCEACMVVYKETFCRVIAEEMMWIDDGEELIELLKNMDDALLEVNQQIDIDAT